MQDPSSAAERMCVSFHKRMTGLVKKFQDYPSFWTSMARHFEKLARRAEAVSAPPESYLAAQFDAYPQSTWSSITPGKLASLNAKTTDANWSKVAAQSAPVDYEELARYWVSWVFRHAQMFGIDVYEVVNDPNLAVPAWFRVLNSNDETIIRDYTPLAQDEMDSPAFQQVKEKLRSVHERVRAGV